MINARLIKSAPAAMPFIKASVFMMWIGLIFNILATFAIGFMIEKLYQQTITPKDMIITLSLILLSVLVRFWANIKGTQYSYHASTSVKSTLRQKIYNKILGFGLRYSNKVHTSQITQVAGEGIEQIEIYFSLYLPQFFYSLLAPLTLFAILSFFSVKVSLVLLICVPLIPASIIAVNKIAKRLLKRYWSVYTSLGDHFLDNLQGLTTLKIYQDDEYKNKEMNKDAEHFRKITMKVLTMQLNSVTLMDLIAFGGAAIGIILALYQYYTGKISLAQTVIFILLSGEFFIPLRLLGSYFHVAMNGMTAANHIFKILDEPEEKMGTQICDFAKAEIELKNLSFSYTPEREILHKINMRIPDNSMIAIVGESGCGKSTIASLLMGFNSYAHGSITINNRELKDLDPKDLVHHMCIVKHKNYFFKGSIEENLRMGKKEATREEMDNALKAVNLYNFVYEEGGLNFQIHDGGKNLSGGQQQRLALARAILHDAKVYIFDEASSNIDAESEEIIFQAIHELKKKKTIIVISHRLANIVDSDKIYVLNEGCITQEGSHEELIAQEGLYKKLYQQQKNLENMFHTQPEAQHV